MAPETALPASRLISVEGLGQLYESLVAKGYRVIGPTVQDGAIVLRELCSAAELPFGWGVRLEPGGYQLRRRDDEAAFGHAAGPQSWKRFLHPPRERLWSARCAFLGVRPCDLRAIAIQDRVLAQSGSRYAARRARLLIVAVNCTERDHQEKAFGRGCYGCFGPVANPLPPWPGPARTAAADRGAASGPARRSPGWRYTDPRPRSPLPAGAGRR